MDVKKFENGEWKNGKLLLSGFWFNFKYYYI